MIRYSDFFVWLEQDKAEVSYMQNVAKNYIFIELRVLCT
jgi:hypothetical protein